MNDRFLKGNILFMDFPSIPAKKNYYLIVKLKIP